MTVTVPGFGATGGAVYVAELVVMFPSNACVVTTASVPQEGPLHPVPLSVQLRTLLGLAPAAGVSVATTVAVPAGRTLKGAESWSEKPLEMFMEAEACFEGSAKL